MGTPLQLSLHMVYALHRQVGSTRMGKSLKTLALCQRRTVGSNAWRVNPFNVVDPERLALSLGLQGHTCCPLYTRDKKRDRPMVSRPPAV